MLTPKSQIDNRWRYVKIGNSSETIGSVGCLITSISMFTPYDPDWMAKNLKFINGALLVWASIADIPNTQYIGRQWDGNPSIIQQNFNNGSNVVIEINSGVHWLAMTGYNNSGVQVIDPIGGVAKTIPWGKISGSAFFKYNGGNQQTTNNTVIQNNMSNETTIVQRGEGLSAIAKRLGWPDYNIATSWDRLYTYNQGFKGSNNWEEMNAKLDPGDEIRILPKPVTIAPEIKIQERIIYQESEEAKLKIAQLEKDKVSLTNEIIQITNQANDAYVQNKSILDAKNTELKELNDQTIPTIISKYNAQIVAKNATIDELNKVIESKTAKFKWDSEKYVGDLVKIGTPAYTVVAFAYLTAAFALSQGWITPDWYEYINNVIKISLTIPATQTLTWGGKKISGN